MGDGVTRRQRILDAIVHRPFFIAPWFIFQNRRWSLLRWMRNPAQCRYEFGADGLLLRDQLQGRLEPEPEQPRLWDTGYMAWESPVDPGEGL